MKLRSLKNKTKKGMSKTAPQLSPEEEAQKEDEQLLSKNKVDIEEIMQLLDA